MITLGMSVSQFQQAFRTDQQCAKYLFTQKYPDGFKCKKCGGDQYYFIRHRGGSFQCVSCKFQESAKSGTLFHGSKISLKKWFQAILEFTISKGGISATELKQRLGFGCYETAWQMLHKLRVAMGKRDEKYQLGDIVEFDGMSFGNRSKGKKTKFFMAVESRVNKKGRACAGFAKAMRVDRHSQKNTSCFMKKELNSTQVIKTDAAVAIDLAAKNLELNLDAKPMYGFKKSLDEHLPWVHKVTSNIKAKLLGVYHGVSSKYVDRYIDEYLYRFNRRWSQNQLQTRMITACLEIGPVRYADVTR